MSTLKFCILRVYQAMTFLSKHINAPINNVAVRDENVRTQPTKADVLYLLAVH